MKHVEYEIARLAFEDHDYTKALRYLHPLATLGHARRWCRQAAEQGSPQTTRCGRSGRWPIRR